MAIKVKFNSSVLFIIIVCAVVAYGIIVEQTSKSYVPIHTQYEQMMREQTLNYIRKFSEQAPDHSPSSAYQSFKKENYKIAYQELLPWGVRFDKRAQLVLGFLNQYGLGVKRNEKSAAFWYFSAIDENSFNEKPMARGIEYMYGLDGHQIDYAKAANWFNMAAQLSDDKY